MKAMRMILAVSLVWLGTFSVAAARQLIYVANQSGKVIDTYAIDGGSGKLTKQASTAVPGNPGPLVFSADKRFMYVALQVRAGRKTTSAIATLRKDADGGLKLLKSVVAPYRAPYIAVDATTSVLLAAHYGPGRVTVQRIKKGIVTAEVTDDVVTEVTAHCIETSPDNRFAFVPHTRPNKLYQFKLDVENGKLIANDPIAVAGPVTDKLYHAPRHYIQHPDLDVAYTSNEAGGGISVWDYNQQQGTHRRVQTLSALEPPYEGRTAAADVHVTPNGKFVYVSVRHLTPKGFTGATKSSLAAYLIDQKTGRVNRVGNYWAPQVPRTFDVDQTGKFVYAGGQRDNLLVAYRINQETGALKQIAKYDVGGSVIWVECLLLD